jgi:hypothetical protein
MVKRYETERKKNTLSFSFFFLSLSRERSDKCIEKQNKDEMFLRIEICGYFVSLNSSPVLIRFELFEFHGVVCIEPPIR